jgi:lysyl-tRNA synthetase class 2
MRELTRDLVHCGRPDGSTAVVDLAGPWPVVSVYGAVSRATGTELTTDTPRDDVLAVCRLHGVHVPLRATAGEAVVAL